MAKSYGSGVSRVLTTEKTQYSSVIHQAGMPPTDAELNMICDISEDQRRQIISREVPSGWLGTGINASDVFITDPTWSNWFRFGQQRTGEQAAIQWAAVNGWLIPVTGTQTGTPPGSPDDSTTWNRVTLNPPPSNSGDSRVDFVFLEVWQALIPPNPGTTNKPSASAVYRYGNVEGGMSFLPDDLKDPDLGFETTKRIQVQHRIRVVTGLVGLQSFPDGFDPANVKARGASATDTSFTFQNMRKELGDPGLWRAGDGTENSLGTVDGYTYAIPLAVVFRRNSVAWDGDPGQNLNGGFNRNPTAVDRTGWKTFSTIPALAASIDESQLTLTLTSSTSIPLPATPSTPVHIQVGDEVMTYSSITGTTITLVARGELGTKAEAHYAGDEVRVVSTRPDGLFSDQIAKTDILDLRHVVSPGGFDYNSVLRSNFDKLLRGQLRANWKRSGGGPIGPVTLRQDKVSASAAALGVAKLDAPDGLRMIWSDTSVAQPYEFIASVPNAAGVSESIDTGWGFPYSGNTCDNSGGSGGSFKNNAVLTLPIAQFKNTLSGGSSDQISYPTVANSLANPWVKIRLAGTDTYLDPDSDFSVAVPTGPSDDLVITLTTGSPIDVPLFITFHVLYGSGRGLSRRPGSVHSVAYLNTSSGTYLRQKGYTNNDIPLSSAWAPLWSKFRSSPLRGALPVTAESYIDPGSKTVILTPFRQLDLPDDSTTFLAQKDSTLHSSAGVMPDNGDPLGLFSTGDASIPVARRDTFITIPRHIMPGSGAVFAPIIHTDSGTLVEGINFGVDAPKGSFAAGTDPLNNFIAYAGGPDSKSFATFTTVDLTTVGGANTPAVYSTLSLAVQGATPCGMRFFSDPTVANRKGLELPKYYMPVRIFAVYEAEDFATNGSAYDDITREATGGGATNLLRQSIDGPTLWITIDDDGDSTFVLNAEALDLAKSPNAISSFEAGNYVLETSLAGFDRGSFDLSDDFRLVLPRVRPGGLDPDSGGAGAELSTVGVSLVVPAPPKAADSIAINYTRSPYMGDAFGSQTNMLDSVQTVGPLTTSDAYTIASTELDVTNLTRENEKAMEVLASLSFATTLGTGRLSGEYDSSLPVVNVMNPGKEDGTVYPPASAVSARPTLGIGGVLGDIDSLLPLGTAYHGCTCNLPLGALVRDKDFRGEAVASNSPSPLVIHGAPITPGVEAVGIGMTSVFEQFEVPVNSASQASGAPGEVIVHVDGESAGGNYSDLTSYRTTRGGSAFVASGDRPGGELSGVLGYLPSDSSSNTVLAGIAYLVRLAPLSIGSTEVSAGSELALLVATTATRRDASADKALRVLCSTAGSGEGYSAVDLYRIEGHPLDKGAIVGVNPAEIPLTSPTSLK